MLIFNKNIRTNTYNNTIYTITVFMFKIKKKMFFIDSGVYL